MTVRRPLTSLVVACVFLSLGLPTCHGIRLPTRLVTGPWKSTGSSNRGIHIPSGGTDELNFNSTASPGNNTTVIQGSATGIQDFGDAIKAQVLRVSKKVNQYLAGIPAKFLIGARSVLCGYHLAAEIRYTAVVNLFLCFGLNPALKHPKIGSIVRRKLSETLRNAYVYSSRAIFIIKCISLAAWGVQVQDRMDRGLEAFFLPTILSYVYHKANVYFFKRASPYWRRVILSPLREEIEYRMILSSIGIRTTSSNKKRIVIRNIDATKASTNNMSLGTSWFTSLLFGVAHIGNYFPIVDPIQAGDDANRLILDYDQTWNMRLFQKVYSHIVATRSQMNDGQIADASRLGAISFLVSRRVFEPVFEKHGVWASIGAHSIRNAMTGSGMKILGLLQLFYGAYTGELPLKESVATWCTVFGAAFLHWVTKMKYFRYEEAV